MKKYLPLLILLALSAIACQESSNSSAAAESELGIFEKISKEDFAKKMEVKKNEILVDVRTPEEFQNGTIQGALNINFYDENFETEIAKLEKTKPIFLFCKSGGCSGKALGKMKAMDFKEVYDLVGGYNGWKNQ